MNLKELKQKYEELGKEIQKYEELGKEIERLKTQPKREIWKPSNEIYYVPITSRIRGTYVQWNEAGDRDTKSFAIFQTENECQNFCNIIEAIAELKAWQKVYGRGIYPIISFNDIGINQLRPSVANYSSENILIGFITKEACEEIIPQLSDNCKAYLRGEFS